MWDSVKRMLVVCAHADDETLGAAGTISRASRAGADVHVVVLSTSVNSRNLSESESEHIHIKRRQDAFDAAAVLGASAEVHDFPDNAFETVPATTINAVVERAVADRRPQVVLTHWAHDLSTDHQLAARGDDGGVSSGRRPSGAGGPGLRGSFVDGLGGGRDGPDVRAVGLRRSGRCRLGGQAGRARLLRRRTSQPSARTVARGHRRVLTRYRGTQVGLARAEAFVLLRAVLA